MRKYFLVICFAFVFIKSIGQGFSNKGNEFWLCFPSHVPNGATTTPKLSIFITSDKASTGTITMPSGGYSATFNLNAGNNYYQEFILGQPGVYISAVESNAITNKSINVKTDAGQPAVVVYTEEWAGARTAATLVLPVNVLGKKYYAISASQAIPSPSGNYGGINYVSKSHLQIIATKDNTTVQITPKFNGVSQTPFTITLPLAGDLYQYEPITSATDITGTYVESLASGNGSCLPIAVFSGTSGVSLGIAGCTNPNSSDPLFQQCYPVSTWGKNFGFIPFANYPNGNPYRILASVNNTNLFFNGILVATMNAGDLYPSNYSSNPPVLTTPTNITSDNPICVAQLMQSAACSGTSGSSQGDPDMVILNPIEQNIDDITVFSSSEQAITQRFVNVLLKSSATASFKINGVSPTVGWQNFAALPGYSYLKGQPFPGTGSYHLSADSGFNAIAYGYGANESYAYSAGTNVKDLYTTTGISTQFGIETTPSVCTGTPFKFKLSVPYCTDSIVWDLHNLPNPPIPSTIVTHYSTCTPGLGGPDSSVVINGITVNWYSLPNFYNVNAVGTDSVFLTTYFPNGECGNFQLIGFPLQVSDPPVPNFSWNSTGCVGDSVYFSETTSQLPKPTYHWWWDFGDPSSGTNNNSFLRNPTHKFSTSGAYIIKYSTITTPGCISDTISKTVNVTNIPTAKFGISSPICEGMPVTFSDTSSLIGFGTIAQYSWNFNNGTAIRTTNSDTSVIYSPWNPSVQVSLNTISNSGCVSPSFTKTFKVNPKPTIDFTLPSGICLPADSARFINNTTLADGNTAFNFLWSFGDPPSGANNNSTLTNPAHYYNTSGPFSIVLKATSAAGCVGDSVTKVLSNVYAQAHAAFSVNAQNCLNDTTYFTDNTNVSGATITSYHWNFGDGSPDVNSATPWHVYVTAGVKTIKHWVNTSTGCTSDTATQTVTVNALPTANFTFSAPTCATRIINFADASIANSGTVNNWQWTFGDGNTSIQPNPTNIYASSGTYTATLKVKTDKGCVSNLIATKTVVVNNRPQAGFMIPEVCLNDTQAQFTDTSKLVGGTINQWQWNFGDPNATPPNPNTSVVQNATHKYTATGAYQVQLIAGNSTTGCTDTITQQIFINGSFPQSNFTINTPTVLCGNDSVYINDSSSVFPGVITKVQIYWDNVGAPAVFQNDDFPYFNKVYAHLYPTLPVTTTYQIKYLAYSGGVCVNQKVKLITINAVPKIQFNAIPNTCYNVAPFLITQASEIGNVPGTSIYSGQGIVSAAGMFNPAIAGIGTHTIKYVYTATAAGCIDSMTQTIIVLDTASAKFSFINPVCSGTPSSFTDLSTSPSGVTLNNTWWNFGDGTPTVNHVVGSTFTHQFAGWGNYMVKMYNTSTVGCKSAVDSQNVYVSPIPQAAFSFSQSSICLPNANLGFINNSSIADNSSLTYLWNFGDPSSGVLNSSSSFSPQHNYASLGNYVVKLITTSNSNCVNSFTDTVDFIHPQPKAAFTIDKPTGICIGDNVTLTDSSNGIDGAITNWNWNFGDGNLGNTNPSQHLYASAATFNISLFIINSNGCNSDTVTKPITVYPYPFIGTEPVRIVLQGGSLNLQPNISGSILQYLWSPATYLDSTNIANPTAINMQDDITYLLTLTGNGGCISYDNINVKVLKAPKIPNTFTPNGDGINDTWKIDYLFSYPTAKVQVFTRTGQVVFESIGYPVPWDGTFNGKPLPFDTYYYIIEPGSGRPPMKGYVTIVK